jgi:hypothetical protein
MDYMACSGIMTNKLSVKDMEEGGHGLIKTMPWQFDRRYCGNSRRSSIGKVDFRDSKQAKSGYKSGLLKLGQPAQQNRADTILIDVGRSELTGAYILTRNRMYD